MKRSTRGPLRKTIRYRATPSKLLKDDLLRLNRQYLVYLRPGNLRSKSTQKATGEKNISKCTHHPPVLRAYAQPDPWKKRIRKKVKQLLCKDCCKFDFYISYYCARDIITKS